MMKLILTCLILAFINQIYSQDLAQWRGKNRDGIYDEKELLKTWPAAGPKLLWHFDSLGDGYASAAVTKERVYASGTANGNGFIIAFDYSGKTIWKSEYGKEWMESYEGVRTSPMVEGDNVYILSGYGLLVCLDKKAGSILWKVDLVANYGAENIHWGITENLVIEGEKLICTPGSPDANVIALNKKDGKLIWKSKGNGEASSYCSPAVLKHGGKSIIATHTKDHIIAIDAADGKLLWKFPWPNQYSIHPNTPLFKDGKLFCSSGYGQGAVMLELAADGTSVKELWKNKTLDNQLGGFVSIDGRIYGAGNKSRKWVCLDWKTGAELGEFSIKQGNIISADGLLYIYSEDGNVYLISPKSDGFGEISKFKVPFGEKQHWAHLVIADKKLFVRHGTSLMVYSIAVE